VPTLISGPRKPPFKQALAAFLGTDNVSLFNNSTTTLLAVCRHSL
jgi:hypothetical protein